MKITLSIYSLSSFADILFALANIFSALPILKSISFDKEERKKKKRGIEELGIFYQPSTLATGSKS